MKFLAERANDCIADPRPSLCGEVIRYAYREQPRIANGLIRQCTPEQIAAAPSNLLVMTAKERDIQTELVLISKGAQPGRHVSAVLRFLTANHQERMAEQLLKQGIPVAADDYAALFACVCNNAEGAAKLLPDRGMDFEKYQEWVDEQGKFGGYADTLGNLTDYWHELQGTPQQDGPTTGGMGL